ncbi:MAG: hypothetical protein IJT83_10860, partial [Victivallales bacterium]|nr:hypothetical protein [Victivallales bacterium]
ENGTGSGEYAQGADVAVAANAAPDGQKFDRWEATAGELADASAAETTFTMPAEAATVTAVYVPITYALTVENGTGSGSYAADDEVQIAANAAPEGEQFARWEATAGTLADANSAATTFTMPAAEATVTAIYEPIPVTTYILTVVNGTGSGDYAAETEVEITADEAPEGTYFVRWDATAGVLADARAAATTFTMPAEAATVTAVYAEGYDEWPADEALYSPEDGAVFVYSDNLVIRFSWPRIQWANGYRLTVMDETGAPLYESDEPIAGTSIELNDGWFTGEFTWKVTAVADGAELESPSFAFTIQEDLANLALVAAYPYPVTSVGHSDSLLLEYNLHVSMTIYCQLFFYSFVTNSWSALPSVEVTIVDGYALVPIDGYTDSGYLYIRSIEVPDDNFIECYVAPLQ